MAKRMTAPVVQTRKTGPPKCCPECGGARLWRDGLRYLADGSLVQRWLCRSCGYRFSEERLNRSFNINVKRRVCVSMARTTKNSAEKPPKTGLAGATTDAQTTKGLIVRFMAYLEKEGYSIPEGQRSPGYLNRIRRLAVLGANLVDPEDVKKVIGEQPWKNSVKAVTVAAYDCFLKMLGLTWAPPKYKPEETLPFVPEEAELDALIAACRSRRMATFLQTLKETFTDPGEALRIEWIDIDFKNNVISINHPVKGHNPRQLKVSTKLLSMLNTLPKKGKRVFTTTYGNMQGCFRILKLRVANVLQNPRLRQIRFTTFRHWGGTMIAHYTHGNVLAVQRALGHKSILSTMKYIHMINFKDDEFEVATATTVEEAKQLATAGFEKFDEFQGIHIFRKPKRFANY